MKALMLTVLLLLVCQNPLTAEEQKSNVLILQKKAEQGYANAQYTLGLLYFNGEGVPQDHTKAREWWRKAAEQGLAEAQTALGMAYSLGHGVEQNDELAIEWFDRAAEQGNAEAKLLLKQLQELAELKESLAELEKALEQVQDEPLSQPANSP